MTAAGGKGIAVRVDHGEDEQVKALFDQIEQEHGQVDILVNNAAIIRDEMMGGPSSGTNPSTSSTPSTLACAAATSRPFTPHR